METIHRINHTESYNFNAPSLATSAYHNCKITTKMRYLIHKDTAFYGETTFPHPFRCVD